MIVRMLVSVSRSDGFSARIGQEIELEDELAQELMTNEQAEPVGAIKLPRAPAEETPDVTFGNINLTDGVDDREATLAGKALYRRKRGAL
jgi:hypothetical protein